MKERPLPFSPPMVVAVRAGQKTQTRRLNGLENANAMPGLFAEPPTLVVDGGQLYAEFSHDDGGIIRTSRHRCPYGPPGDRLWMREAWRTTGDGGRCNDFPPRDLQPHKVWYEADGAAPADECVGKYRPPMFMPRWACRQVLEIVSMRVERLQDISDEDAKAEGIERGNDFPGWYRGPLPGDSAGLQQSGRGFKIPTAFPVLAFRALWESINGVGSWAANPWVWVVEFRRLP